jgi:hypothetical protein
MPIDQWRSAFRALEDAELDVTDSERRALMIKARELIEITRHEISELQKEIQSARDTIDQSQKLLSRTEPSSGSAWPRPLNLGRPGLM